VTATAGEAAGNGLLPWLDQQITGARQAARRAIAPVFHASAVSRIVALSQARAHAAGDSTGSDTNIRQIASARTRGRSPDPGRLYHYVLTIQWQNVPNVIGFRTAAGPRTVRPGDTRAAHFASILDETCKAAQVPAATVLFFSLEPDLLDPASSPDDPAGD
jgi:hypothetical protein